MADAAVKPKTGALDVSLHVSTHNHSFRKAMSTRRLITNRHDALLRSGSTHQLLNRPFGSSQLTSGPLFEAGNRGPPPGAAESLATQETAEDDLSESGSDFSGDSFGEAAEDTPADPEYLSKMGASLHDDELEFNSGDEADGADGLIDDVKARMKLDEAKEAES